MATGNTDILKPEVLKPKAVPIPTDVNKDVLSDIMPIKQSKSDKKSAG